MYIIAGVGFLLSLFSLCMVFNAKKWSQGIIYFSEQVYFHWFEVLSRLIVGLAFIYYAPLTLNPSLILSLGYLLVTVACGLLLLGQSRHKQFALWSANKFQSAFPIAGICAFPFGIYLVYIATGI